MLPQQKIKLQLPLDTSLALSKLLKILYRRETVESLIAKSILTDCDIRNLLSLQETIFKVVEVEKLNLIGQRASFRVVVEDLMQGGMSFGDARAEYHRRRARQLRDLQRVSCETTS